MGKINYKAIYEKNRRGWLEMTEKPGKYEALLAGHYSDSNHFVYELIQNAEDAKARSVVFEYHKDRIVFFHDGKPFNEADVIGVSSMLETTKADDAQTIGKFGMGFKSVFKYTCEPSIYSDEEAFGIKSYLLPVELEGDWDYQYQMREGIQYSTSSGMYFPFAESEHLTRVELPFQKRDKDDLFYPVDGSDIILKLKELEPEILLFLKNIKNLFWVDMVNKRYEKFWIMEQQDQNLLICQMQGNAEKSNSKRYSDRYYLKYQKNIFHPKMGNAEVSFAFLTNQTQKSVQKIDNPYVWVYFPTKDKTELPCLLHGSFETAVSREKLMRPSEFNDVLLGGATELFAEAVLDIAKRGLLTQNFVRQIIIPSFSVDILPRLKAVLTDLFKKESLIPGRDGELMGVDQAILSMPYDLVDLNEAERCKDTFLVGSKQFVLLNDEKGAGFSEYYTWLTLDLHVSVYSIKNWAEQMSLVYDGVFCNVNYDEFEAIYRFLDSYKLSDYEKETKFTRKRSQYEEDLGGYVKEAWPILRKARILINADNRLVAAFDSLDEEQIYLSSTSEYHKISKSAIVLSFITSEYKTLLEESFGVKEFDNFEYVKGKVIVKYMHTPQEVVVDEKFTQEYAADILQICRLMMSSSYVDEVKKLIEDRCIILARNRYGKPALMSPSAVYKKKSIEGADMQVYFKDITKKYAFLEEDFYQDKGISLNSIMQLGIHVSPVELGPRSANEWKAIGDFCPYLEIESLRDVIAYIQDNEGTELSIKKSASLLRIVLENVRKMSGKIMNGMDTTDGICKTLDLLRKDDWVYSEGMLVHIEEVSKNQLDYSAYGDIHLSHYAEECRLLGFTTDATERALDGLDNLDYNAKQQILRQLAQELGVSISAIDKNGENTIFNPEDFDMNEFPVRKIANLERLNRYVENQFYAADPVRYREVVVRQRQNGNKGINKAYVQGMYTNHFGKIICQGCKRIMRPKEIYTVELANFGIEMEQLRLCMCPNCYHKYEAIKMNRKEEYKASIKRAIENEEIANNEECYTITASSEMQLHFTQTHLAEVQMILQLLDKYGVPMKASDVEPDIDDRFIDGKLDEIVVHDGEMIEYETMDDMKKHKVELDIDRYKLHYVMNGRPIGVVFEHEGRKYRITQKF